MTVLACWWNDFDRVIDFSADTRISRPSQSCAGLTTVTEHACKIFRLSLVLAKWVPGYQGPVEDKIIHLGLGYAGNTTAGMNAWAALSICWSSVVVHSAPPTFEDLAGFAGHICQAIYESMPLSSPDASHFELVLAGPCPATMELAAATITPARIHGGPAVIEIRKHADLMNGPPIILGGAAARDWFTQGLSTYRNEPGRHPMQVARAPGYVVQMLIREASDESVGGALLSASLTSSGMHYSFAFDPASSTPEMKLLGIPLNQVYIIGGSHISLPGQPANL